MTEHQPPKERQRKSQQLDPQHWVERHGDYLYRYALRTVRSPQAAEDIVQESLLAAWRGRDRFAGLAKERSWLTSILKRKVIDWLYASSRRRAKMAGTDSPTTDRTDDPFDKHGKWRNAPKRWQNTRPDADTDREEFWAIIQSCSNKLPVKLREVFYLCHLDERDTTDVCEDIGVTPNNLWVMLHRARLGLWQCLSKKWFGLETSDTKGS
jgi:RNA polymerase sigma-70 factor (TIGR02943 family)